jgi:hypothetical protein
MSAGTIILIALLSLPWIYIAARLVAKAVVRSIREALKEPNRKDLYE